MDDDVVAAIDELRRAESLGMSEALNWLVRRGLSAKSVPRKQFRQQTARLGLSVDVSNVAETLETLEGLRSR